MLKKIFFVFIFSNFGIFNLFALADGFSGGKNCNPEMILKDEKIDLNEINTCSLDSISRTIPYGIAKKYNQLIGRKFNEIIFNVELKEVKSNFAVIHFIPDLVLKIVLNDPVEAGLVKNFLEITPADSAGQALASHQDKGPRVQAEIDFTKLKYFPNPIKENLNNKKVIRIFPKYARPIFCGKPFYIRLNFGDIGLVVSPARINYLSITEKGNLKTGKVSAPITILNKMINENMFYNIYEAQIWGDFNVNRDVAAIIMPENHESKITDPKTKLFIERFKKMNRVFYYNISNVQPMKKFGDYEYDRVGNFISTPNRSPCRF